ncbi:carboxylesterase [Streptomyces sp. CB02923]|uniref:carboxylesterase/lipase family protein n=1 Tax=Streptomyces sp. CB02923 TaxID=1718985 RepID=UPI00093E8C4B|nr:carboxylesterase family protein [Streptomyces sp. CB02923]OKI02237.1 carboxylesterase [Streptomyces sp. CB02923]
MTRSIRSIPAPEVRTSAGSVRGRWQGDVAVFRGIPYARPPVGDLHLAAPVPALPWDGVREADAFGPPPPQSLALGYGAGPQSAPGADDWLTVNVFSPDPGGAGLAVMVWLYGGVYMIGSADGPGYDGTGLARRDTVVVTFNHRVGAEGYGQFAGAPPNRALLDQVAALEWVRDNIAAFGGDPGRVTVFGESAGAGAVAALMTMPRAAGLFHRAVAQSVPGTFFSTPLASDIGAAIAAELGVPATRDGLAPVAPGALRDAADSVWNKMADHGARWGRAARARMPFAPVVDGDVLPRTPWEALRAGQGAGIDLVVGHTRDECRGFTALSGRRGKVTEEEAAATLEWCAPDAAGARAYRTGHPAADPTGIQDLVMSDWLFRMPSLHLAEAHVAGGGTAYLYEMAWPSPAMDGALGACHGLDVPLVFGAFHGELAEMLLGKEPSPEARALSESMMAAWTAFAGTGTPGWSPYRPEDRLTRVFTADSVTVPYPAETSRLIWADWKFAALEPTGGA